MQSVQNMQNMRGMQNLPNQTYQTKPTKSNQTNLPNLPNPDKPTKLNLRNQIKLSLPSILNQPTKPKLLVKVVNTWVRSAFGNVSQMISFLWTRACVDKNVGHQYIWFYQDQTINNIFDVHTDESILPTSNILPNNTFLLEA